MAFKENDWRQHAGALRRQRIDPLLRALGPTPDGLPAATRWIALPSPALTGIPLDLLRRPEERWTVTYAPSGTLYAWLCQRKAPDQRGLLAIGDPIFHERQTQSPDEQPRPTHGLLVRLVVPNGNAANANLRPGDVLLSYDGAPLHKLDDLRPVPDGDRRIPVEVWRDGIVNVRTVAPGRLGVNLDTQPAPEAVEADRRFQQALALARGGDVRWLPLPATAWETSSLAKTFQVGQRPVQSLLGLKASEPALLELAQTGQLASFGYVHLATHARIDVAHPARSALIVSQVDLPDPVEQMSKQLPLFDGEISVAEIVAHWKLNAHLVTLSACETALGAESGGEGYVGFTQALLIAGADALCLSLWKVDDTATALLMDRFYANLLGQRPGLPAPLSKAEALAEAQVWLRELTAEEVNSRAEQLGQGVARGPGHKVRVVDVSRLPQADAPARPYAHPYYWSAFVLVGKRD